MVDASVGSTRARVSLLPQHFPVALPQHRRSRDLHLSPEGHDLLKRLVEPAVVARLSRLTRRVSVMPAFSGTPR